MARRREPQLTPQLSQQIVAAIRAGGYPHVAAQAWGVSPAVLEKWRRRGSGAAGREPWRSFLKAMAEAHAQARLKAEVAMLQDQPRIWLEHGPGRERRGQPGWSAAVRAATAAQTDAAALLHEEVREVVRIVLNALAAHPDLRQRLADELAARGADPEA
ncbi:MAG: hypothetical protein NZO58_02010 [Gemmataceae bacterium]|nr:hypothetical protein [Gemmataceae bacterium]